jgi:hypothetical protein
MYLKVHPTVPEDESSLCYTCRFATVITGRNPHDQIVECMRLYGSDSRVRFAVARCTGYADSRRPTVKDFEDVAWVLRSGSARKRAGFLRPSDPMQIARASEDDEDDE